MPVPDRFFPALADRASGFVCFPRLWACLMRRAFLTIGSALVSALPRLPSAGGCFFRRGAPSRRRSPRARGARQGALARSAPGGCVLRPPIELRYGGGSCAPVCVRARVLVSEMMAASGLEWCSHRAYCSSTACSRPLSGAKRACRGTRSNDGFVWCSAAAQSLCNRRGRSLH